MEWLEENPRRPPKQWMRHCVAGASASSRDPGAVCGALWYHKMSASQRRAALAKEGKMQENAASNLLMPLLIGGAAVGALLLWMRSSSASSGSPQTTPAPLPPAVKCVVSQEALGKWAMTVNMTALYVPMLGITDPVSPSLAIDILPSEIRAKIENLPSNEQLVLVDKNDVFHYFANDQTPSVRRDDLYADYCNKVGGTLAGTHPADFFLF